jgi:hypothetical protein
MELDRLLEDVLVTEDGAKVRNEAHDLRLPIRAFCGFVRHDGR